jgi:hypothetical protein
MNWSELNLNEVDTEKQAGSGERSELPSPATYKLRLVGSKPNPYQSGTTDIDFAVADGQYKNKHLFASLPSPDKGNWVQQAAAILIKRLGGEQLPGEELVDTLTRLAQNSNALITADVAPDTYTNKQGETKTKPKLQFFSVAAAV